MASSLLVLFSKANPIVDLVAHDCRSWFAVSEFWLEQSRGPMVIRDRRLVRRTSRCAYDWSGKDHLRTTLRVWEHSALSPR